MNHGWAGVAIALLAVVMLFAQFGGNEQAREIISPAGMPTLAVQNDSNKYLTIKNWPPKMDAPYPDIPLVDEDGAATSLNKFKGRIVFVIPTYMGVPESQVLAGAQEHGALAGGRALLAGRYQGSITSMFKEALPQVGLPHKDIVFVHLLVKNQTGQQASTDDAQTWRSHFKLSRAQGHYVFVQARGVQSHIWDGLAPGVHLLDDTLKLRASSAGSMPEHNLHDIVFPMVPVMLDLKAAQYQNVIDP